MPNNLDLILAAAKLIEAAGECIKNEQPYNSDLIGALAEMHILLISFRAGLNEYWEREFYRQSCDFFCKRENIKEDENDP